MFEGIADQAADDIDGQGTAPTEEKVDTPTETQDVKAEGSNDNEQQAQATKTPEETPDLAKFARLKFEGQEMTYDDLRRAYLRHKDYTQKTQALAEERKFFDNLSADLRAVQQNPQLANEFKKVYPEKFHGYLGFISQAQATGQQQAPTSQATTPQLPPEVISRIEKNEQMLNQVLGDSNEAQQVALNSVFETMEQKLTAKYPHADLVHAYSGLNQYLEENGVLSKEVLKNPAKYEAEFERYVKKSHEYEEKKFAAWEKQKLEKAKEVNRKASDIGRGSGSAPTTAPPKMRLKDVADAMLQAGPEA